MVIIGPFIDPWSGPVRTEVLNENPRIVRFYEVMHDWEIEHIRSISQNVMERSQVLDKGGRAKSYERNVFQNRQKIMVPKKLALAVYSLIYFQIHLCMPRYTVNHIRPVFIF